MSYVDGNSGTGRKALTGGTVALIQAGLALALVNGFAVTFLKPAPPEHLADHFFPTRPLPPEPAKQPKVDPKQQLEKKAVDNPIPPTRTPQDSKIDLVPQPTGPVTGTDETGSDLFPTSKTIDPPARFTPSAARARNDMAGWVTTDDYPTADARAGHTGTVRFRLAIDAGGRVTDCTITQSSGYPGLDAATCRNVNKRARFDPATDAAGERIAGNYAGTIRWVIPRD